MKRRTIIKAGIAGAVAAAFTAVSPVSFARGKRRSFMEYDRNVCRNLDGLVDYNTGKEFKQDSFIVAYFSTPYQKYQGCATDALTIYQQKEVAERMTGEKILPVLIVSPLEEGDPYPGFAKSYTNPDGGNFYFKGLTGDKDDILDIAHNYRVAYEVDRHSGRIIGHNRSCVLISPRGELLAKFPPDYYGDKRSNPFKMGQEIALQISDYDPGNIRPARACEP